ncbi:unnamed protein product [Staurois parvus]|uniref:Uncharacterized protein n=1 Tax=Staurois parvus TaxID=386267 RepID=A0ABN9G4D9_9NEOB|nr:unnamed protein product [Staurois parvus]
MGLFIKTFGPILVILGVLVTFSLADSVRFQPTVAAAPTYTHRHF